MTEPVRARRASGRAGHRSGFQRERDLVTLADLLNRYPYDRIHQTIERFNAALEPGRPHLSRYAIIRDINTLIARWRSDQDIEVWHARITRQVLYAQQEFMEAWQNSKRPRTVNLARFSNQGAPGSETDVRTVQERREEESYGDPTYLLGYLRCIERLSKLWALEPPARRQIDLRLIREEVDQVARELNIPSDQLMHQVESLVRERWSTSEPERQPIAAALELDTALDFEELPDDDESDV